MEIPRMRLSLAARAGLALGAVGAALALAFAPALGLAKSTSVENERKPIVDPRADSLLREMSRYLSGAEQFTVRAQILFDDVLPTGQKVQYAAAEDLAVRRPNRVYAEYEGDVGSKQFWYDGKAVTMYDAGSDVWATTAVPARIDEALDDLMRRHGFSPPLSDLLYSDPYAILKPHAQFGLYMGTTMIDGTRCHHLAFVDKEIDWQIWVEDGTQVVPCKMLITYKSLPGSPQFAAVFSDWEFGARLIDSQFEPKVPPGATKIDFLSTEGPSGGLTKK